MIYHLVSLYVYDVYYVDGWIMMGGWWIVVYYFCIEITKTKAKSIIIKCLCKKKSDRENLFAIIVYKRGKKCYFDIFAVF